MSLLMDELKQESINKIEILKMELGKSLCTRYNICIFVCGSLGRFEMSHDSDLDLFFIMMSSDEFRKISEFKLDKYCFFSKVYEISKVLKYKEPSKNGHYWDFISKHNLLDIGSREEDYNNSFTARMLLMLESKPIFNILAYNQLVKEVVNKYFIDYDEHSEEFFPLYLMNDILRYWYTLTLNYEYRRDEADEENKKYWKRLKLKYARLITCFSMLACMYKNKVTPAYVMDCINMTPFERLEKIPTIFSEHTDELKSTIDKIKVEYEWFLRLRQEDPTWWNQGSNKQMAWMQAQKFHQIVIHDLMGLVAKNNTNLRDRSDVY
jgi:hypothetical protein